jgi:CheY-like chemotaxis protein
VHVIGGGIMGGDIATWCAMQGLTVTIQDMNSEALGRVIGRANKAFKRRYKKDKIRIMRAQDNITPDINGYGIRKADVIIEAIFENLEAKQKLFKAFSQTDASTTRKYGGTGLGLSISKRLVELMNGTIDVESTIGDGTTFIINIAFKITESSDEDYFMKEDLKGLSALIIDDNENNRLIFKKYLSYWQIHCREAEGVDEAVDIVKAERKNNKSFDLIFVDYHMPEKNGIEFARIMKSGNLTGKSQMIMISSISEMINKDELMQYGFKARIFKPVKVDQFKEVILKALNKEIKRKLQPGADNTVEETPLPGHLKILLAEDNLINQKVAKISLKQLGYDIDIAHNGKEAVDMHLQHNYDIILMDIQMPEMNGMEATAQIEKKRKNQESILLSLHSQPMQ